MYGVVNVKLCVECCVLIAEYAPATMLASKYAMNVISIYHMSSIKVAEACGMYGLLVVVCSVLVNGCCVLVVAL